MNKQQLRKLTNDMKKLTKQLEAAAADAEAHAEEAIVARCDTCERRHAFDNERGQIVSWDGDLWFLNDYQDAMIPLGHTRGGRRIVPGGDPEQDITLGCLEFL